MENHEFLQKQITNMQDDLKKLSGCIEKMMEHSKERDTKIDAMYQVFTSGSTIVTVLKFLFGLLIALGGAYLLFKNIFLNH